MARVKRVLNLEPIKHALETGQLPGAPEGVQWHELGEIISEDDLRDLIAEVESLRGRVTQGPRIKLYPEPRPGETIIVGNDPLQRYHRPNPVSGTVTMCGHQITNALPVIHPDSGPIAMLYPYCDLCFPSASLG